MKITRLFVAASALAAPVLAIAGPAAPPTLPEPETLALLAIGAVALGIARWRRKK